MRRIAVGWAVLLVIFAPIIIGGLIGGANAVGVICVGYIVVMMLALLTAVAALIGESIFGVPE